MTLMLLRGRGWYSVKFHDKYLLDPSKTSGDLTIHLIPPSSSGSSLKWAVKFLLKHTPFYHNFEVSLIWMKHFLIYSIHFSGWLGWAMVLGSFQCRGVLLLLHIVGQGPAVLAAAGAGWVGYIFYIFHLSSISNVLSFGRRLNMTEIL